MVPRTPERRPKPCHWCGFDLKNESPVADEGEPPCPRCGHRAAFTWETEGEILVIKPTGPTLGLPLSPGPVGPTPARVAVDLGAAPVLVSSDLARLLKLKMQLLTAGGKLTLRNAQPAARKVFRMARLDTTFEFEE